MVAGLTLEEELDLARAENRRYRAAVAIAMRGLADARDQGFADASAVLAHINAALSPQPAKPTPSPPWRQALASARRLLGRPGTGARQGPEEVSTQAQITHR
jgi:hypothetical protein